MTTKKNTSSELLFCPVCKILQMTSYTNNVFSFGSAQPGDSVAVCEQSAETDERLFGST